MLLLPIVTLGTEMCGTPRLQPSRLATLEADQLSRRGTREIEHLEPCLPAEAAIKPADSGPRRMAALFEKGDKV